MSTGLIVVFFLFSTPSVYYVGVAYFISAFILIIFNCHGVRKSL